jgi:hypothetical protein
MKDSEKAGSKGKSKQCTVIKFEYFLNHSISVAASYIKLHYFMCKNEFLTNRRNLHNDLV